MKILGTLTVDTPNALDKVTDLNADLLDGKSSELFLSKGTAALTVDGRFAQRDADSSITSSNLDIQLAYEKDFVIFTAPTTPNPINQNYENVTNSLTIKSTGRIGIGKADPSTKLHLHLTAAEKTAGLTPFIVSNSADTALFQIDHNGKVSVGKSTIGESPTNLLNIFNYDIVSSGGLSIKNSYTVASTQYVDVLTLNMNGSSGSNNAELYTNKQLNINAANGTTFDGNVGIGSTNSPVAKLDIGGNAAGAVQAIFGRGNNASAFTVRYTNGNAGTVNAVQGTIGLDYASGTWADMAAIKFIRDSTSGALAFYTSAPLSSGVERMRIDSSGNVGIGITPSTWSSGKVLEIGNTGNAIWGNSTANMWITENTYYNSGWKYASANPAATYQLLANSHIWSIAPTGTINTAVTFTQAMTLSGNGNLLIGKITDDGSKLQVEGSASVSGNVAFPIGTNTFIGQTKTTAHLLGNVGSVGIGIDDGGNKSGVFVNNTFNGTYSSQDIRFLTTQGGISGATERMRINVTGNVLIGKTTDDGINKLQVEGSASVSGNVGIGTASPSLRATIGLNPTYSNTIRTYTTGDMAGFEFYDTQMQSGGQRMLDIVASGAQGASYGGGAIRFLTNPQGSDTAVSRMLINQAGNVGIGAVPPTEKLHVAGNILATGTVIGSNISNSYVWVFAITSPALTAYNTSDAYNASNNYVRSRTGDTVGSAFTNSATLPSFYDKNVVVYRSTTTSSYSAYEQVFPDITITTGGVCTISFAVAQTVGYVFRVIFS